MTLKTAPRPFLRWIGGKARRARILADRVPLLGDAGTYFEPFLGGASVFFAVNPPRAVLSDANEDLMCTYRSVQRNPKAVWNRLEPMSHMRARSDYYAAREEFNRLECSAEKAAHFIYLNRMSFNGIYRVNRDGHYNVPFGGKENPAFPTLESLRACAESLRGARLSSGDFESTLETASSGDFVYVDPPYLPINGTSYFRHYTPHRFDAADHHRLATIVHNLSRSDVRVMVTVGDHPTVRDLYEGLTVEALAVRRYVGSNGDRRAVGELVVTNFG